MPGRSGRSVTREYRRNIRAVLRESDVCGICGHGGARTGDHIIPAKAWPRDPATGKHLPGLDDVANLQPAHGSGGSRATGWDNPCPVCHKRCNQNKNGKQLTGNPRSQDW